MCVVPTGKLILLDSSSYEVGDKIQLTVIAKNPTTSSEYCLIDEKTVTIQVISNECHKNPCENDATCKDGPSRFVCYCRPGILEMNFHELEECIFTIL